jgi:hypothetical protein
MSCWYEYTETEKRYPENENKILFGTHAGGHNLVS